MLPDLPRLFLAKVIANIACVIDTDIFIVVGSIAIRRLSCRGSALCSMTFLLARKLTGIIPTGEFVPPHEFHYRVERHYKGSDSVSDGRHRSRNFNASELVQKRFGSARRGQQVRSCQRHDIEGYETQAAVTHKLLYTEVNKFVEPSISALCDDPTALPRPPNSVDDSRRVVAVIS